MTDRQRRSGITAVRRIVLACVFVLVAVGLAFPASGIGSLCSFGIDAIAAVCPLGVIEVLIAGKEVPLRLAVSLVVALATIVLLGKAFCSWVCPVPPVRSLFSGKRRRALDAADRQRCADSSVEGWKCGSTCSACASKKLDLRHAVLGGALLSTAIFGLPVFCLVCPVGLTIATFAAVWQLVQLNEVTWGLVVFPAIVVVEMLLFRKWCSKICPIGALLSLVSHGNKTFVLRVDHEKCLRDVEGQPCMACAHACPELIDPYTDNGIRSSLECVKCHRCADACPTKAITFPALSRKAASAPQAPKHEG